MSNNGFPFTSRAQVVARIASESSFAVECVKIIESRKGWMASHRARAAKLIARLASEAPTQADCVEAAHLASRYGKTLARIIREGELTARPELAGQAATFGVMRPTQATSPEMPTPEADSLRGDTADVLVVPKKRGRPKGSKNKVSARASTEGRRRKRS